jgi:tetratricopeptide (TPR) repeat protein
MNISFQQAFTLHQQGEIEQAKLLYEDILQNDPNHFDALHMLGVAVTDVDPSRAVQLLSKALGIDSTMPECFNNAANALMKLRQHELALECARQAISLKSDYWQAYANAAESLRNLQRQKEALDYINAAIHFAPNIAKLYSNRGNLYEEQWQYEQALIDFGTAIVLDPNDPQFYVNRGIAYQALNQIYPAIADQEKAVKLNPLLAEAQANLAMLYLLNGDYRSGWSKYGWRWKRAKLDSDPLQTTKSAWQPGSAAKRVLVWGEQGVGDHIFFGSLLLEIQKLVPDLLVQIDERLISLFERSMPGINFYPTNQVLDESLYDAHLAIGDLGGIFRNHLDDFLNGKTRYLQTNSQKTNAIKEELSSPGELLIGISWRSKNLQSGTKRTLDLSEFVSALNMPGVKFVSLQYGDIDAEIEQLHKQHLIEIIQYKKVNNQTDLDDLASLISACDLIISAANTTVHLAGALNIPCWVLLPKTSGWQWLSGVTLCPWYPSIRLYRQKSLGYWGNEMQKIREDLIPLLKSPAQYN